MRPKGKGHIASRDVRRVALPLDAACLSWAAMLQVCYLNVCSVKTLDMHGHAQSPVQLCSMLSLLSCEITKSTTVCFVMFAVVHEGRESRAWWALPTLRLCAVPRHRPHGAVHLPGQAQAVHARAAGALLHVQPQGAATVATRRGACSCVTSFFAHMQAVLPRNI